MIWTLVIAASFSSALAESEYQQCLETNCSGYVLYSQDYVNCVEEVCDGY